VDGVGRQRAAVQVLSDYRAIAGAHPEAVVFQAGQSDAAVGGFDGAGNGMAPGQLQQQGDGANPAGPGLVRHPGADYIVPDVGNFVLPGNVFGLLLVGSPHPFLNQQAVLGRVPGFYADAAVDGEEIQFHRPRLQLAANFLFQGNAVAQLQANIQIVQAGADGVQQAGLAFQPA